jgi:transcriptional regulator with PAS, ATPase and Fis domain
VEQQVGTKYSLENIVGESKEIKATIDLAKRVAFTDTTVLISGDTRTGKEV